MGAGVTTLNDEKCELSKEEIDKYVGMSHFTIHEIKALYVHFRSIPKDDVKPNEIKNDVFQMYAGFHLRESTFINRIFNLFDGNKDGYISFDEFVSSASILSSKGTIDQKTNCTFKKFNVNVMFVVAFQVFDENGDQVICKQDLNNMVAACIQENGISMTQDQQTELIKATFTQVQQVTQAGQEGEVNALEQPVPDSITSDVFRLVLILKNCGRTVTHVHIIDHLYRSGGTCWIR